MQDVFRRLAAPSAVGGLLRLRASRGVAVAQPFGPTLQQPGAPDVYRLPSCDGGTCLAFGLDHEQQGPLQGPLVLQMAFQYTSVTEQEGPGGARRCCLGLGGLLSMRCLLHCARLS